MHYIRSWATSKGDCIDSFANNFQWICNSLYRTDLLFDTPTKSCAHSSYLLTDSVSKAFKPLQFHFRFLYLFSNRNEKTNEILKLIMLFSQCYSYLCMYLIYYIGIICSTYMHRTCGVIWPKDRQILILGSNYCVIDIRMRREQNVNNNNNNAKWMEG